jgi:hypothetical protein
MDYKTKVTVTSTLLAVLVLTAVLGTVFSQQAVVQRQASEPLLAGFQASAVTGLELGNGVVLKKDKAWNLTFQGKAYPVSVDRVETYLKTISTNQRERLVTKDGDGAAFGLDKGFKTLKVLGTGGQVIADLQIGGTSDLGDKTYVRFAGTKEIWQTDRGFSRTLDLDFNTWADLSLYPGKKSADLTRVTFDSRIETSEKAVYAPFDLVKATKDGKSRWEDRLTKVSTEPMTSWADLVASFRVAAFAGPTEPAPAGSPIGTVTTFWGDGSATVVKLFAPDAQNRYRATDGTRDFWVTDWSLGQLLYK